MASAGVPRSQAGPGYATLWIVIAAARIAFSYATSHSHGLQAWLVTRHITADAITDALIFMAAGMLLLRTATLRLRTTRLPGVQDARHTGQQAAASWPTER